MKSVLILIALMLLTIVSCGSPKSQIAVETGCPKENIKLIAKQRSYGRSTFAYDVCGKRMVYKKIGTVYMKADESENFRSK